MFVPRHADAGVHKGRGTAWAMEHRFSSENRSDFDDGWGTLQQAAQAETLAPATQLIEENVRGILSGNDSPDIGFDLSINPYRGCERSLHLLLRAAQPQLSESLTGARFRDPHRGQGQRCRETA